MMHPRTNRWSWRAWSLVAACLVVALPAWATAAEETTAVADAAQRNDVRAVRALLREGASVDARQADGMSALHWAVYHDRTRLAKRLIASGAEVQAANRYGITPLAIACLNGNGPIAGALLDAGADPNADLPGDQTPLMIAARTGRPEAVAALLAHGAKVDARERKGQTALMWAAAEGNRAVVDQLLEAGADWRITLASGFNALMFAVREGQTEVALRLLQAGADINQPMRGKGSRAAGPTPLILAVENGHFETAEALLQAGADPNAHPMGYTALHAITWVRKPIRGDGDPPPIGSGNLTSLDMVRRLIDCGADIDARLEKGVSGRGRFTTTGSTPFLLAARASDVPLLRLLKELGADPDIPNADHCPPLLAAAGVGALGDGEESAGTEEEAIETIRLLLEWGADINAVDDNGETAMHGAAYQSRAELVAFLTLHGAKADVWNRKNEAGWTPVLIAEGHRPGNFRPSPETLAALEEVLGQGNSDRGADSPPADETSSSETGSSETGSSLTRSSN